MKAKYNVGDKIYFAEEKRLYTVRACGDRFLIGYNVMAKVKMVYKSLSKEEKDKFDKPQQEFYKKYIKYRKENNDEHTATKNADNSITECHNGRE